MITEGEVNVYSGNQTKIVAKGTCMTYHTDSFDYDAASCAFDTFCSICQIDRVRLRFTLKGICDDKDGVDKDYFLLKDPNNYDNIYFYGLTGSTNIVLDGVWKIIFNFERNDSRNAYAIFNGTDKFPIGLKTWYLFNPCNSSLKSLLKLTNVSYN